VALPPFQRFLDAHRDAVFGFLVAAAGRDAADDLFQETFLAAMRAYPRLRPGSNPRAWVLTIAANKATDHHRARARHAVPTAQPPDVAAPEPAASQALDGDAWDAVRALPPRMRSAVLLRVAGELSHREVATALGCSEDAARRAYADAIARLRTEVVA
jgi:RNA polymerase sigma factor (sigma-70 family)